ncbi:MAG: exodeoxyribonuclease V subunit gamma, partial [Clostridia bacterium]|nr:exodeoxyribonuclease V subunit gamma [Clostridia bacterium]
KFGLYKKTHIVMDNYISFSKQQIEVIKKLLVNCPSVTVTLTTDNLEYKSDFEVFYKAKKTAKTLCEIAYDNNVKVLPNTYLKSSYYKNEELKHLADNYFKTVPEKFKDTTENIFVLKSKSCISEIEQVASEIMHLVRDNGYRYRDIAVITRNTDEYYPVINDIFDRYGIYFNITESANYDNNFVCRCMMSVFDIVVHNYSFDSVFEFVRSDFCDICVYDKFLLENYVLEVGNTAGLWSSDRDITFKASFSDNNFERIKKSVYYVRGCIKSFTENFSGRKTAGEIVNAYNAFLKYIKADEVVKNLVTNFKNEGKIQSANETISAYNHIISSLNQMSLYFGDISITFEKFYKILWAAILNSKLDAIPSGVDDVQITSIDRFQASSAKAVFVVGLTEGTIPCGHINEGVLKGNELSSIGIEDNILTIHCDENYIIYRMFNSADERIYFSYPLADSEGNAYALSPVIAAVKKIFPNISVKENVYIKDNYIDQIDGIIPTFNRAVSAGKTGFWEEVIKWYKENMPEMYDVIIRASEYKNQPKKLFKQTVLKLYGKEINSSISKIEKYNMCAFAYFIQYGLNVKERKEFKIEFSDYGTYMHEVIEKFSDYAESIGWKNVTDEICKLKTDEITKKILNDNLGEYYTESKRHTYLFNKISSAMQTVVKNIADFYKESNYVSIGYEIKFADDAVFKPITINLSDGTVVKLRGQIDRADVMHTEKGDLVCIVDYKSGKKDIEFEKILCGIQIQLPVYLDAVCKNLGKGDNKVFPAAMLYYHIDDPVIKAEGNISDEKIREEIKKELKMRGVLEEESNIPSGFVVERVARLNSIDKICRTAYKKVSNALEKMISGDISINPVKGGSYSACDYCPYGNICNFDENFEDNKYRKYKKIKMEEFLDYVD